MLEQHNKDLLDYLKTHTNQQGKTYLESFTETMEEQRKAGHTATNTIKKIPSRIEPFHVIKETVAL